MTRRLPHPFWIFLATVVLVVVSLGVRIGIPAYRQHSAIREIETLGGTVETIPSPEWLCRWLGRDRLRAFEVVEKVDLGYFSLEESRQAARGFSVSHHTDDRSLMWVEKLPNLKKLHLSWVPITDAGIEQVSRISNLEVLYIRGTKVSDASIPFLKRLTRLRILKTHFTKLSDAGIADLKLALPDLQAQL